MYRTHTCGCLRACNVNETVTLAGWVQKVRNLGAMTFIDLRDRYGITQIVVEEHSPAPVRAVAGELGREYVVQVTGRVVERSSKNPRIPTGEVEVTACELRILNRAQTPPFTIEEQSDGGDDLRMKYRYLDLRRPPLQRAMILRHRMAQAVRTFLDGEGFLEIETPYLIKSTPEGARDFVVPSRMNPNEFYALPQSPQTLKQLLMVAGYDRYFQIVRCFRDEDLRATASPNSPRSTARCRSSSRRMCSKSSSAGPATCSARYWAWSSKRRSAGCPGSKRWNGTAPTSPTCASAWSLPT